MGCYLLLWGLWTVMAISSTGRSSQVRNCRILLLILFAQTHSLSVSRFVSRSLFCFLAFYVSLVSLKAHAVLTLVGASGALLTLVALFIPFAHLNDMVSAGVLISFILCNCSLLNVRYGPESPSLSPALIFSFVASSGVAVCSWNYIVHAPVSGLTWTAVHFCSVSIADQLYYRSQCSDLSCALPCSCIARVGCSTVGSAQYLSIISA